MIIIYKKTLSGSTKRGHFKLIFDFKLVGLGGCPVYELFAALCFASIAAPILRSFKVQEYAQLDNEKTASNSSKIIFINMARCNYPSWV